MSIHYSSVANASFSTLQNSTLGGYQFQIFGSMSFRRSKLLATMASRSMSTGPFWKVARDTSRPKALLGTARSSLLQKKLAYIS